MIIRKSKYKKSKNYDPLDVKSRYGTTISKQINVKPSIMDKITDKVGVIGLLLLMIGLFFAFLMAVMVISPKESPSKLQTANTIKTSSFDTNKIKPIHMDD